MLYSGPTGHAYTHTHTHIQIDIHTDIHRHIEEYTKRDRETGGDSNTDTYQ